MTQTRTFPYAGIEARWEEQQFAAFQQHQRAYGASAGSYADFVFGRLLEEDLHASCSPMLPAHVDKLHSVTLQGMCILQIVDVVNIGANFEHRKEDATGPTRTLKICFTDGHQLVFGFEYRWLPSFSMSVRHGTKVLVMNADVRHGLLMLTPQNCRLLGLSGNELLEQTSRSASAMTEAAGAVSSGAYSAALMTTQFTTALATPRKQNACPAVLHEQIPVQSHAQATTVRIRPPSAPTVNPPTHSINDHQPHSTSNSSRSTVTPPVFVDVVSSEDDCDSDKTDPMVQHLFYSPNTPRLPGEDPSSANGTHRSSRKRPREAAIAVATTAVSSSSIRETVVQGELQASAYSESIDEAEEAFSFSLLGSATTTLATNGRDGPPLDPTSPFQYFSAQARALSAAENPSLDTVLHIRACIKSVAGFQFNTGLYLLKVIIEDCTETKEVSVDAKFVEKLMGVSCIEFMRAMQKTPAVAHQWAARMQFALMTLEGVMDFRMNPNGTFTLLDCRDVSAQDAHALLQRVKASVSR